MQVRRVTALTMVAALALVACDSISSSPNAVDRDHGIPILASEVHRPGTPLGDGFKVPVGAVLAGSVLPGRSGASFNGYRLNERRWTAMLGVGGAPRAVAQALLAQANAAGIPGLPAEPYCDRDTCGFAGGLASSRPTGRSVIVQVGEQGAAGASATVIFVDYGGKDSAVFPHGAVPIVPGKPTPGRKLATGRLPKTGDPIELHDWPVTVVAGTKMVLPVLTANGLPQAILRVTGDPDACYRAYVRQLAARMSGLPPKRPPDVRIDGWIIKTIADGEFGTRTIDLLTRDGRSYIRLSAVND